MPGLLRQLDLLLLLRARQEQHQKLSSHSNAVAEKPGLLDPGSFYAHARSEFISENEIWREPDFPEEPFSAAP